jgi:hypothetical protein
MLLVIQVTGPLAARKRNSRIDRSWKTGAPRHMRDRPPSGKKEKLKKSWIMGAKALRHKHDLPPSVKKEKLKNSWIMENYNALRRTRNQPPSGKKEKLKNSWTM